jgi:Tol biopolymer transport system component
MNRPTIPALTTCSTVRRVLLALEALIPALLISVPRLSAQDRTASDLPVIEPRLTRIIGADTLQIANPTLSPDGRWVVFQGNSGLWIVPSEGGEVRRLIEGSGRNPAWFPDGGRISYWEGSTIIAVPFDTRSGQVSGPPQRITLELVAPGHRISPDGRWIVYWTMTPDAGPGCILRIVPSNGGTPRTVGDPADLISLGDWSVDGRYIYYRASTRSDPDTYRTLRAPVQGGVSEEVTKAPSGGSAPTVPYWVAKVPASPSSGLPFEIQAYDGESVARLALPEDARVDQPGRAFSSDGRRLLAVVSNTASPVRILPVAGGPPRQLGDSRATEVPWGWSPDGREVLFSTAIDGRQVIMSAPVDGGAAREVGPMPYRERVPWDAWAFPITFSADGRFLTYSRPTEGSPDRTLVVRPVAGGEERVITRSLFSHEAIDLTGPGGTPNRAGNAFLYLERNGRRVELRAAPPEGSSRLIRSFPESEGELPKSVFENRVAYLGGRNGTPPSPLDPSAPPPVIFVADGPDGAAKEVAAVPGIWVLEDVVWSPDGRWIAGVAYVGTGRDDFTIKILLVGVTPEGDVSSPPRLIDTPLIWAAWELHWLPDGSAVTLYGMTPPDGALHIWLIPVQNNGRPVQLTRDEQDGIVLHTLSPDGRFLAYQAEVQRGSSLWLADLGDALKNLSR